MVAFLNNDISNAWLIVFLQLDARVSDGQELIMQDLHTKKAAYAHLKYFQIGIFKC